MKGQDDQRLFVYGELCKPAVLMAQLRRVPTAVPAVLEGYRRRRSSETGYYRAEPQEGARLPGLLLRGLDAAELDRLDAYEEVEGGKYRRRRVQVTPLVGERSSEDGSSHRDESLPAEEAWIYVGV